MFFLPNDHSNHWDRQFPSFLIIVQNPSPNHKIPQNHCWTKHMTQPQNGPTSFAIISLSHIRVKIVIINEIQFCRLFLVVLFRPAHCFRLWMNEAIQPNNTVIGKISDMNHSNHSPNWLHKNVMKIYAEIAHNGSSSFNRTDWPINFNLSHIKLWTWGGSTTLTVWLCDRSECTRHIFAYISICGVFSIIYIFSYLYFRKFMDARTKSIRWFILFFIKRYVVCEYVYPVSWRRSSIQESSFPEIPLCLSKQLTMFDHHHFCCFEKNKT
jgi:hypothetical protein